MWRQKSKDGTTQLVGALTLGGIINALYPVGSVIASVNSANPGVRFTGTTWVAFGAGRAVVGVGSNGTNTYTTEQAFGSDGVTLTAAQSGVNAHTHTSGASPGYTGTVSADHKHGFTTFHISAGVAAGTSENNGNSVAQGPISGRWEHTVNVSGTVMGGIDANHQHIVGGVEPSGVGTATSHENRQTSIAVYLWKRTV